MMEDSLESHGRNVYGTCFCKDSGSPRLSHWQVDKNSQRRQKAYHSQLSVAISEENPAQNRVLSHADDEWMAERLSDSRSAQQLVSAELRRKGWD
jgi:hypothetical protein